MEDIPIRSQPLDRNAVISVDNPVMRMCVSSVLLHSISIRKLPEDLENLPVAVTITINGSSFTTKAVKATEEGAEKDLITGESVKECVGKHKLYKIRFDNLNLLFPGSRRSTRRDAPPVPDFIANPRELPEGIKITLHTEDLNHVFGTTTCKGSGEAAYLSFPRGEATLNFRVYPCVDGETMMEPLYNRTNLAKTYLNGQPPAIEGAAAEAEAEAAEGSQNEDSAAAPVEQEVATEENAGDAIAQEIAMENAADDVAQEQAPLSEEVVPTYQEAVAAVEAPVPDTVVEEEVQKASRSNSNTSSSSSASSASSSAKESVSAAAKVAEHVAALQRMYAHSSPDPLTAAMRAIVPCYNVPQMEVAFSMYDEEKKGVISRTQLIHFCRAHQAYSDCWSDDEELLKSLAPYIPLSDLQREAAAAAVVSADGSATEAAVVAEEEAPEEEAEAAAAGELTVSVPRVNVEYLYYHPSNPDAPIEINKKMFFLIAYRLARA